MSLDDKALEYLRGGMALTPKIAEQLWGVLALHSLISRLRKRGLTINCKMRRDAATRRIWGEYRLVGTEQLQLTGIAHG